jgi:hypothetical protein
MNRTFGSMNEQLTLGMQSQTDAIELLAKATQETVGGQPRAATSRQARERELFLEKIARAGTTARSLWQDVHHHGPGPNTTGVL